MDQLHFAINQPGGEKFIHRGILFKYAVDVLLKQDPKTGQCLYMYGGSTRNDELAMKAAGNELRGKELLNLLNIL